MEWCDPGWTSANGPVETLPFDPPLSLRFDQRAYFHILRLQSRADGPISGSPTLNTTLENHALT